MKNKDKVIKSSKINLKGRSAGDSFSRKDGDSGPDGDEDMASPKSPKGNK